jgi:hypothetical protein
MSMQSLRMHGLEHVVAHSAAAVACGLERLLCWDFHATPILVPAARAGRGAARFDAPCRLSSIREAPMAARLTNADLSTASVLSVRTSIGN